MIDALIAGRLHGAPAKRTDKNGKPFATAKVRVALGDGEAVFLSCIAFAAPAVTALLALSDGDSIALAGSLSAGAYIDRAGAARPSLDLMAQQVLTAFHVGRKRKAMQGGPERREESPARLPFDDDLPGAARPAASRQPCSRSCRRVW